MSNTDRVPHTYCICPLSQKIAAFIHRWMKERLLSLSATLNFWKTRVLSVALPPRSDYGNNEYKEMPWLDCETVNCNCSKFPQLRNVVLTKEPSPKVSVGVGEEDSSDDTPTVEPSASANDDDDNLDLETTLYSEYVKLKGCTYHEQFQVSLKSCKLKQRAGEEIPLRLFYEPTNMADENAVVAQVLHDQKWISIGYIPGKKVEKIIDALLSRSIKIVQFKKIIHTFGQEIMR